MALSITEVPADVQDEQTEVVTRSTERDEDQRAMDARVADVKAKWEAAGKPVQKNSPYIRLGIPKAQRSEVKKIIRRAAVLHGVEPLYWKDTAPDDNGIVRIKFTVGPKKVKENGEATDTQPAAATDTPPANSENADQGGDQPQATPTPADTRRGLLGSRR